MNRKYSCCKEILYPTHAYPKNGEGINAKVLTAIVNSLRKKRSLNQNKNTNIITYKTAGNLPYCQNFALHLKPF